jgi:hypothetical protein
MPPNGKNIEDLAAHRRRHRPRTGGAPPGGGSAAGEDLVLDPAYPLLIAEKFVDARHLGATGKRLLLHHREVFYSWNGTAYVECSDGQLRAEIYDFVKTAKMKTKDGIVDFDADKKRIDYILDALKSCCRLTDQIAPPAWIGPEPPADLDPRDILVCQNCLLHLPTRARLLHTPDFFTLNAVDYDFDPGAPCPQWLEFLAHPPLSRLFRIGPVAALRHSRAAIADPRFSRFRLLWRGRWLGPFRG